MKLKKFKVECLNECHEYNSVPFIAERMEVLSPTSIGFFTGRDQVGFIITTFIKCISSEDIPANE